MPSDAATKDSSRQRSKKGCQQCRRRKRKCDEQQPYCAGCLERNLTCNFEQREEATNSQKFSRRIRKVNKDFALPHEMGPLTTVFATPIESTLQKLVSHFSVTSPLWLTVGGNKKIETCLRLIMPALKRSHLVLDCVLAVAAGDLSKYQPASSDMRNLSYGFYGQAINGIQSALSNELVFCGSNGPTNDTDDDTLLAILLLCVHEAVNFTNSDRMIPHINAAAVMCYYRSSSVAPDPAFRGLLFELFCYIFTLTAFSLGHSLQLTLALQVFNSPFLLGAQYQGILVGISLELFSMILRISVLTHKPASPSALDLSSRNELQLIETQLYNWRLPHFTDDTESIVTNDENIISELYRLACLIHVKKVLIPDLPLQSDEIQNLLLKFVTCLNTLPSTSPANGILCWPLVVAGTYATVKSHRRIIIGRLRKMNETWRSDILSGSADLLCKKWREDRTSGGGWVNIQDAESSKTGCPSSVMIRPFDFPIILV